MNPASWLIGGAIKMALSVLTTSVDAGAAEALRLTGSMLSSTTSPGLQSSWFSTTYWRVAALSALLTVPFLFAAAVHALVRSDLALLGRAAFGYLPLALIGVTIAAPLATLLLSATDEMGSIVAGAAGHADGAALARAASGIVALSAMTGNPMLAFFIGLLALLATIGLWIELLVRAAAVDVIVLMLPLFFAAMVWPARRVWAIRAIETLVALILAKFAIVAVLTLGGAAFGGRSSNLDSTLVGATLIVLAVLSPWALLRVLPLHEVAAAAAGGLSAAPHAALQGIGSPVVGAGRAAAGGASAAGGDSPGLDPEDDADAARGRAVAFAMPRFGAGGRIDGGAAGGGVAGGGVADAVQDGGMWPPGRGAPPPGVPRAFVPETAAGLAAVAEAGRRAGRTNAPGAPVDAPLIMQVPQDDRPPINEQFAPGERDVFELGPGPMQWPGLSERASGDTGHPDHPGAPEPHRSGDGAPDGPEPS
ncbi:MAG TPA: hypothetical protein VKV21_05475 [Solirubrobacteraceae bacterium]|nr:hypothetical protein [Solirubrobacteraceae bacterium]